MKRFIALISIILMCVAGTACKGNTATRSGNSAFLSGAGSNSANIYLPSFADYNEYKEYIEEKNAPESFLSYDDIKDTGKFVSAVFISDFESYMYTVKGKKQTEFIMYVYHSAERLDEINVNAIDFKPQNTADMRTFCESGKLDGVNAYTYNNIRYSYYEEKLDNIQFYADGKFIIFGSLNFSKYPLASNTFQSKLLNLDTAVQAITEHFGTPQPIEDFFNQG